MVRSLRVRLVLRATCLYNNIIVVNALDGVLALLVRAPRRVLDSLAVRIPRSFDTSCAVTRTLLSICLYSNSVDMILKKTIGELSTFGIPCEFEFDV